MTGGVRRLMVLVLPLLIAGGAAGCRDPGPLFLFDASADAKDGSADGPRDGAAGGGGAGGAGGAGGLGGGGMGGGGVGGSP